MSEPYEGEDCPFCGSTSTLAWTTPTAYKLGYRLECLSCQTRWKFPAASDITELDPITWTIASAAISPHLPGDSR